MSSKKGRRVTVPKNGQWTELAHGFNCKCKSMSAAFTARGPSFKGNFEGKPFESVRLHSLCILQGGAEDFRGGSQIFRAKKGGI